MLFARDIAQPAPAKLLADAFGRDRQLVALLDAVEADPRRIVEALRQADVRAERAIVVVGPGDWVRAVEDHGRSLSLAA
jgi:hypothetical protein